MKTSTLWLRSLYRKRRIIFFWCIMSVTMIALYHKLNLNFNLTITLPSGARQNLQLSSKGEESVNNDQRVFQKTPVPQQENDSKDGDDDGDDEADDDNDGGVGAAWKLKTLHFYLNNTKETSTYPAHHIGRYIMLNPNLCRDAHVVDIIIVVHTAPPHFEKRQRIRETFAKRSLFLPFEVRVAFLMGRSKKEIEQQELIAEHGRYNDTVMGDFVDDYHNLTLKGVMGYRWIHQHCSNARFVLKIDDDVIVDMYTVLTRYVPHMEGKRKSIFCNVWRKNMRIERGGKWKVPKHIFSNTTVFPFYYCSGFTLLMSRDMVYPLYSAAKSTPSYWIDDLYLFGILPFMVGGVTYHDYQIGRNISIKQEQTFDCWTKFRSDCSLLSTLVRKEDFTKFWMKIQQLHDQSSWKALTFFEP